MFVDSPFLSNELCKYVVLKKWINELSLFWLDVGITKLFQQRAEKEKWEDKKKKVGK